MPLLFGARTSRTLTRTVARSQWTATTLNARRLPALSPCPPIRGAQRARTAVAAQARLFSSSICVRQENVQALIGYAFAGKPRYREDEEDGQTDDATNGGLPDSPPPTPKPLPRQGFPQGSQIGDWVDKMLHNGEAGEDMVSVVPMRGKGDWLLAVADGVGGWSENGIDPALFSQALMFHATEHAQSYYACPDRFSSEDLAGSTSSAASQDHSTKANEQVKSLDVLGTPLDILAQAHQNVESQPEVVAGSSTACILTFDASKGVLRSANLGDSGFLILRLRHPNSTTAGKEGSENSTKADEQDQDIDVDAAGLHVVHYQSHPQLHGFNTPFQLSKLPPSFRSADSIDSTPKDAHVSETRLREGDIVLLATDGFWDNVSSAEVLQLVAFIRQKHQVAWQKEQQESKEAADDPLAEERSLANVLAHNLLQYARICQFSTTKSSPFEREARRHGIHYPGGKVDDVSIVTALIVER